MHYLVKYGYYGNIEDIKQLLDPLLSLLDGRNDKPYPKVEGTLFFSSQKHYIFVDVGEEPHPQYRVSQS